MRTTLFSLALLTGLSAFSSAFAQDGYVPLEQRLSAEQMQATGLSGLDAGQLALLNRILREDAAKNAPDDNIGLRKRAPEPQSVAATLTGEIRGWSPGQVLTLDNGQQWRVIDGTLYLGKPASNPKVTVRPGMLGAWYLQMEGESPKAKVQRIR